MGVAAVLWAPVRVLGEAADGHRVLAAFLVTSAYALLGLVGGLVDVLGGITSSQFEGQPTPPGLPPGTIEAIQRATEVGIIVLSVLSPFVTWLVVSLLMQLVTRFFGGEGPLSGTLAAIGVAQMPLVASSALGLVLTLLQVAFGAGSGAGVALGYVAGLLGLGAAVWYAVLVVIGSALARRLAYGEATASCAISCIGILALIILVGIVAIVGAVVLLGPQIPQQ